ncbi:hypothetical protein VPH35_063650 [Triticum aestivum]
MEMSRFSEEAVAGVVPIIVYWAYSGVHMALGHARLMDKYRLNTKDEEDSKNMVSSTSSRSTSCRSPPSLCSPWYRYLTATCCIHVGRFLAPPGGPTAGDALTCWCSMHTDTRGTAWRTATGSCTGTSTRGTTASWCPTRSGAIYGHPIEVLIDDTASGLLAVLVSGLSSSPHAMAVFLSLCNIKGIDNHCGLCLLPRRLQSVWNGAAHHGLHHMPRGVRFFGMHMPYAMEERPGGQGLVLKPMPMPPTKAD